MGGRHKLTHSPKRPRHRADPGQHRPGQVGAVYLWSGRGLLVTATALLLWSGATLAIGQDVTQTSPDPLGTTQGPDGGSGDEPGSDDKPVKKKDKNKDKPLIEPPLNQPRGSARVRAGEIQAPTPSVGADSIEIPALSIKRDLIELAVVGHTLQVPEKYSSVGWWRDGPVPGEKGASVMVGHVDSPTGPAVFYQLSGLRKGDRINVGLEDGSRTVFEVREIQVYDRTKFPSAKVYRQDGPPGLNLLTCGGSFDTELGLYSSNVVVFTELVHRYPAESQHPPREAGKQKAGDKQKADEPKQDSTTTEPAPLQGVVA